MALNRKDIAAIADMVTGLYNCVSTLMGHVTSKRVSHTVDCAGRAVVAVHAVWREVQAPQNYAFLLEKSLREAREKGHVVEWQLYDDGTVFISGSFHLGILKDHLLTVPFPTTIVGVKDNG